MHVKRQLLIAVSTWGTLIIFLALSNPGKLPVVVYIIPFVLLFLALYGTLRLIRSFKDRYLAVGKHHRHLGVVICASVVLLLVLQSIGQLSIRDVIIFGAFIVVGYLYLKRSGLDLLRRSS